MKNKRNSSIELLKIIAIIIIIISHSVPFGSYSNYTSFINLNVSTADIQNLLLIIFRYFGSLGNCIFIVCSCYFLINSKKVKLSKIIRLIIDTTIISILIMLFFKFGLNINGGFTPINIVKMILPVIFSSYWFITAYIIVYTITPLLNNGLSLLDKKTHFMYVILLSFIMFINTFVNGVMFFNDLIGFISLYVIIAYIKKYHEQIEHNFKINLFLCIVSFLLLIGSILIINYLGQHYSFLNNQLLVLNKFYNPLIVVFSISLLFLFKSKNFKNNVINYISTLSLLIYLFHGQQFIVGYLKGRYYDYMILNYGTNNLIIYTFILVIIFFVGSVILSVIYKSIEDYIIKLFKKT